MGYQDQQAGFLDRVFNSTISLPQQFLWRIYRAMEDDDIDLFSEKGLLDAALIPALGVFDDHKEDVMPDYMAAETKGWFGASSKRADTGFGSQLAAAILTDPLTYMTGGLSAIGKVGKSAQMARRSNAFKKVLREASKAGDTNINEMLTSMRPQQYIDYLDDAIEEASKATTRQAKREVKHLTKTRSSMLGALPEAEALHQTRALKGGAAGPAEGLTMAETIKQTNDRRIAIGLPVLSRFGAKYDISRDYGSWWQLYKDGVNKGGRAAVSAYHLSRLVDVPGVNTALKNMTAPIRHGAGGWRIGREAQVALSRGVSVTPEEAKKYGQWLSPDGAAQVALDTNRASEKFGGNQQLSDAIKEAYEQGIKERNMSHEDAFKFAFNSVGIGRRSESGSALFGRVTGRTKDNTFFPKWGAGATRGKAQIDKLLTTMMDEHAKASKLHQQGRTSVVPTATETKITADSFEAKAGELAPGFREIAEFSFEKARSAKAMWNTVFRSGTSSVLGEKAYAKFVSNVARDNDQLEQITQGLYQKLNKLTQGNSTLSSGDVTKLVTKLVELDTLPGEIAASFGAAKMNPSNSGQILLSMDNFLKRQRRSLTTIEKLLKKGGIADEATREKLLGAFEEEIFPFLELEGKRGGGDGQQTLQGAFNRLIKNQREERLVFTPQQQTRMRRANNKHLIRGAELPLTPAQEAVSQRVGPDAFTALGQAQRGAPESAMLRAQKLAAGELFKPIEDVGDLTHRLTEDIATGGYGAIKEKLDRTLRIMDREGFEGFVQRNIASNAAAQGIPEEELAQQLRGALGEYADAHAALPVYNEAQELSRDAAVALGRGDYAGAVDRLKKLQQQLNKGPEAWAKYTRKNLSETGPVNVRPRTALEKFAGRQAGTLTNAELDEALGELDRVGQRAMSQAEVLEAAEQMPAIQQFAKRTGVSTPEALKLLSRSGDAETRIVKSQAFETKPLWNADQTRWTAAGASSAAEDYGFRLVQDEKTGLFSFVPTKIKAATLKRSYGYKPSAGYRTYREAMTGLRTFISGNKKYAARYGPSPELVDRPIKVAQADIDDMRALLSEGDMRVLNGKQTVFDDAQIPEALLPDYQRLSKLRQRRSLPKDHKLYDEPIIPKKERVTTAVDVPRSGDELEVFLDQNGIKYDEGQIGSWAVNYTRSRLLMREVMNAIRRSKKAGLPVTIDPKILADIESHVQASGAVVRDIMTSHLPKEFNEMMDLSQKLGAFSFEAAKRAGVWMPGSPVAYLPRFFNKAARSRIARIMGNIEQTDGAILTRLGVSQAQYYKRQWDEMSVDDLNEVYFELREAMTQKGASPKLRQFHKELDKEMKEAGIGITGLKKALPWMKEERVESDAFLALLQRFGVAQQDANLEKYFTDMLAASTGKNGESLMMGGKIVGIVDDTGNVQSLPGTQYKARSVSKTSPSSKDPMEIVALTEETIREDYVPKSLLIELPDGTIQTIENNMFEETGFGLLALGKRGGPEVASGTLTGAAIQEGQATTTLGSMFASASLRSDLHNSMVNKPMKGHVAESMLGQNVVLGSEHNIVGLVKTAAQVHQVTPQALRSFDAINYGIKSFQTIFRLPFHIANLSSGVFQAHLAGATPKNLAASYIDTMRFLAGDQKFADRASMVTDMFDLTAETSSLGIVNLAKGDKAMIQQAARMHGSGEFHEFLAKQKGYDTIDDLDQVEDLVINLSDGTELDMREFIQTAGEMQLYGTFASSLTRGSRTVSDNLMRIKMQTLEPSLGGRITGAPKRLMDRMANVAESSEVINRTATALALVREGHPVRRAIEIAKEAHVPYEKLTPFEKNAFKRFSVYYTFPRHYMPWAWTKFAEDPAKLSGIAHFIRDQNVLTTQEGKPNLVLGDYRVDLGRLNANLEAAGMIAAFADRLAMPAVEAMVPGFDGYDIRKLRGVYSDAGITNVGGLAGMALGNNILRDPDRDPPEKSIFEEATRIAWPFKIMAQLAGKAPKEGVVAAVSETLGGAGDERSPYVEYTPLESWLTDSVFGVGTRKVRQKHELVRSSMAYRKIIKQLQMRAAATDDKQKRARFINHAHEMSYGLRQILSETKQKAD